MHLSVHVLRVFGVMLCSSVYGLQAMPRARYATRMPEMYEITEECRRPSAQKHCMGVYYVLHISCVCIFIYQQLRMGVSGPQYKGGGVRGVQPAGVIFGNRDITQVLL